ncbi:MAG: phenylalanine--tRNA ligase subunit beta, partial [Planctomycetota bacterium]
TGQPLHAFDRSRIKGDKLIVRAATKGEQLEAIDHRTYDLVTSDCVIADESQPLSIAGIMGGSTSEVTDSTTDLIIEVALFTPLVIRRTARRLKLHSPSSFRFERRTDPVGVDWVSRRACQLITQLAGGHVDDGILDSQPEPSPPTVVALRHDRMTKCLGREIATSQMQRILSGLGCSIAPNENAENVHQCTVPSWRHDLTREIDLIEEVARIDGYDQIPEDSPIPIIPSSKRVFDVAVSRARTVLTSAGFSEAMTPSVVTEDLDRLVSPWSEIDALQTRTAMLVGSKRLRRSLIPSLVQSRAANFASASVHANLFEIAHVYLPPIASDQSGLPTERYHLGFIAGDAFFDIKGIAETLFQRLGISGLSVQPSDINGFARGGCVTLHLDDDLIGVMGVLSRDVIASFKCPGPVTVAEVWLDAMVERAQLVPQQQPVSPFPAISRDLNLVLPESVRWIQLATIIRAEGGDRLTDLAYQETYRNQKQDGDDRKRILFSMQLQSHHETLSGDDADAIVNRIVDRCESELNAVLKR